MTGIMQVSTETAVGPGVADLAVIPDPIPDYGWTHRWEAYAAPADPGEPVALLKDLIGSAHLSLNGVAGQSGATAPTLEEDADGRFVLRFDSATERLSGALPTPPGSPFTYVAVFRPTTLPTSPNTSVVLAGASTTQGTLFLDATTLRINGGTALGSSPALTAGKLVVVTAVVNGASSVLRITGRTETAGTAGTGSPTAIMVGASGGTTPTNPFTGDFIAGYITPGALTLSQREEMEAALKAIHGIL